MTISLNNTGKRFNREWIFRHCSYEFHTGGHYAITGPNGSGKSTLLQVIAGAVQHNEGEIRYTDTAYLIPDKESPMTRTSQSASGLGHQVSGTLHYQRISIAAPYLELIEEMTAKEMLGFHAGFKSLLSSLSREEMLTAVGLPDTAGKQIRYFSSGMKQRLKLALAFFSDTAVLLLDEPTTNLDAEGIALYRSLISNYTTNRLVIVSSNVREEYDFCKDQIRIEQYK